MSSTVSIPREEYDFLKKKADLFDRFVESEELDKEDLAKIRKALKGPFLSKSEFLKRHSDIS